MTRSEAGFAPYEKRKANDTHRIEKRQAGKKEITTDKSVVSVICFAFSCLEWKRTLKSAYEYNSVKKRHISQMMLIKRGIRDFSRKLGFFGTRGFNPRPKSRWLLFCFKEFNFKWVQPTYQVPRAKIEDRSLCKHEIERFLHEGIASSWILLFGGLGIRQTPSSLKPPLSAPPSPTIIVPTTIAGTTLTTIVGHHHHSPSP
ncbi:hypothetical protein OSB04_014670 [Centaurea solstitialis]|uniref:Uncharacterized protein n=1 Tax=Centaurea solstitialis TaxID=347529 RepID=A0AA38WFS9_9ASTR|nr:hypothetical protein OSB04_014670 [Centaurea solstitialis]